MSVWEENELLLLCKSLDEEMGEKQVEEAEGGSACILRYAQRK
jgi:hypothetical protein